MPIPTRRPTGTKSWGPLGYLKDLISPPGYVARGPFGARSAAAATRPATPAGPIGPTQDVYEQPGVGFFDRRTGAYLPFIDKSNASGANTPITTGLTRGGGVDRTQSDTYKQYAQTPEGQFQRYFQSPEMDQYFGAASRGAGAPKDLAAMNQLASQAAAPTSAPLASYYRAQSAAGRGNMEEVVGGLTYGKSAEEAKNLEAWARANPMLAFRQYNKQFPAGAPTMGGSPSEEQSFSVAANSVPAPWNQQGAQVDANRGAPALFSKQAEFTTGEGMPQFQTTLQKAEDFLGKQKSGSLF